MVLRTAMAARRAAFRGVTINAMAVFLLTLGGIAIVMAIMAIGVMLGGRCLRGSCGGPEVVGPDGGSLACAACPRRTGPPATGG